MDTIRTRIAPSPTGNLHIGTARTALFNYAYAKKHKGRFLLRIEDTDKERSKKEFEENIIEGLSWLGFHYDKEIIQQSERKDIYKKYLKKLLDSGSAYESKEKEEEGKRESVIRFKNPGKKVVFSDLIRGEIEIDTSDLGNFVIAKDFDTPLYHLAVVVDDLEMNITHIIRGEDHISNTPRQILIQEALHGKRPSYAHLPLILAEDRSKLSKRHGAMSISEYKALGYEKDALVNFLALLGWRPIEDAEIFSLEKIVSEIDLSRIQKGGAIFDIKKLNFLNKHYLKKDPEIHEKIKALLPKEITLNAPLQTILLERITILSDITKMFKEGEELDFILNLPNYESVLLREPKKNPPGKNVKKHLEYITRVFMDEKSFHSPEKIKTLVWDYASKEGRGEVLWGMRVALTGKAKSPDPFTITSILGKDEAIKRLKIASGKL